MADRPTFLAEFKEFAQTDAALIDAKLAAAALEVPTAIWGAKTDRGIYLLTAHMLASSPFGNAARLNPGPNGVTVYWPEFERMRKQVSSGFRVT